MLIRLQAKSVQSTDLTISSELANPLEDLLTFYKVVLLLKTLRSPTWLLVNGNSEASTFSISKLKTRDVKDFLN